MYFNGALWEYKSNAKNVSLYFTIPMVVSLIAVFFTLASSVKLFAVIPGVIFVALLAATLACGRKFRWNNPTLIFALTDDGIYFTSKNNTNSYFQESYSNISGYSYIEHGNDYVTVTVYFKTAANAGIFGNITYLKMVNVRDLETLKSVFSSHGVEPVAGNAQ